MNRCPIQIIDEPKRSSSARWISLLKNIDFEKKVYHNVVQFHKGPRVEAFNELWVAHLFRGHEVAPIDKDDIIRNPTIEEWKLIKEILLRTNSKINLKRKSWLAVVMIFLEQ